MFIKKGLTGNLKLLTHVFNLKDFILLSSFNLCKLSICQGTSYDCVFIYITSAHGIKKTLYHDAMAKRLISEAIRTDYDFVRMIGMIAYHLKRNRSSYLSYKKKSLLKLKCSL